MFFFFNHTDATSFWIVKKSALYLSDLLNAVNTSCEDTAYTLCSTILSKALSILSLAIWTAFSNWTLSETRVIKSSAGRCSMEAACIGPQPLSIPYHVKDDGWTADCYINNYTMASTTQFTHRITAGKFTGTSWSLWDFQKRSNIWT